MISITNPYVIIVAGLVLIGTNAFTAMKVSEIEVAACENARLKANAAVQEATIQKITANVEALEKLNTAKDNLEVDNDAKEKRIEGLRIANGRLVAATGGLFDRNGKPTGRSGVSGSPGSPGVDPGAVAGCQLSGTVTDDLLDLTRDADLVVESLRTCRGWVDTLTAFYARQCKSNQTR